MCRLTIVTVFFLSIFSTSIGAAEEPPKPRATIEELTKAIEQNDGDAWAYIRRAQAYNLIGKFDLAEQDLGFAFLIDVFPTTAHRALAHEVRSIVRTEKREFREAVADLNQVLRLNPDSTNVHKSRGLLNYRLGEYHLAKSDYEKAIDVEPKQVDPKMNYARLLACCPLDELRDGARAVVLATEACEMTEWKNPLCVVTLSLAHAEKRDFELALSLLDLAAESDPEIANGFKPIFLMKIPFRDRPLESEEIRRWSEEIRRNPKDSMPHALRGSSYLEAKNPELAIADFNAAIKLEHFPSPAHRAVTLQMRATARFQKQQYREALADLNETVKLDPTCQNVYAMRGYLNYYQGEYKIAKSDFVKAIEENPKDYGPKTDYARLLACCPIDELRDGAKAVELATKACEMTEWKVPKCLVALSCAHAQKGDFDLAVSLLDLAAETDAEMTKPLKPKFLMKVPHRDQATFEATANEGKVINTLAANSKPETPPPQQTDQQRVLTTAEAANHVGKEVLVEMRIRSTGSNPAGFIELYSAPTWQEEGCFFVRFSAASQTLFKKYNITDIGRQFRGTTVRLRGEVKMLRFLEIDHPVIYVEKLDQIEIVTNDGNKSSIPAPSSQPPIDAQSSKKQNPPAKPAASAQNRSDPNPGNIESNRKAVFEHAEKEKKKREEAEQRIDTGVIVGARVWPKSENVIVKLNAEKTGNGYDFETLGAKVEKIDGTKLSIAIQGTQGKRQTWIEKIDAMSPGEAIVDFQQRITKNPNDVNSYSKLAGVFVELGKKTEAESTLTNGIENNGNSQSLYSERAQLRLNNENIDGCLEDLDARIALGAESTNPASLTLAHFLRGTVRLDRKRDADKAILDFDQVLKQWPQEALAYTSRGRAWVAKGEYQKALADYSTVLRIDPKNAEVHNRSAWIWATCSVDQVRDGAKAVSSAELACSLTNSKSWSFLDTLAAAYACAGRFDKAVESAQKAVDLAPDTRKNDLRTRLELYRSGRAYIATK